MTPSDLWTYPLKTGGETTPNHTHHAIINDCPLAYHNSSKQVILAGKLNYKYY